MQLQQSTSQSAHTILVVEDDAAIRDVISTILGQEGFDVVIAENGERAIEAAANDSVDLVLLDVMLPDVTGYEVCRRIRTDSNAALPIVMLTALGAQEHVVSGLELGADDYLVKPFDARELVLRIEGLLRRSQQTLDAERALVELSEQGRQTRELVAAAQIDAELERTLRRELLHNVTTHMRSLSRVADVAVRRFPAGPLREVVEQLRMRIGSASLMYEISANLQAEPVDAGNMIQVIARALKEIYRPWRRVVVEVRGPELYISAGAASPLALIINELVSNALRHAFPEMRFGTVNITYGEDQGQLVFTVADDGVGFDIAKPSAGRGRYAVQTLTGELGGTISWTSSAQGTRVDGTYPLIDKRSDSARTSSA